MQPASQLRITNLHHLALALDLSESQMLILARRAPLMYCKRQHGKRTLLVPQSYLKRVQQKIVRLLMTRLAFPKSLQGGLRGRSAIGNARIHVGRHYLGQTDIRSFFPSVRPRMVYDAFVARGCAPDVARILTQLTTTHHQLPQGAPSSPVVANLVLWRFAERFEGLARSYGVMASVYLDDITLSGGKVVLRLKEKVLAMIRQLGLRPHPDETKTIFDATDKERVVTGVRVDGLTIAAPSEYIAKLEVAIKTLRDTGVIATQLKSIRGRIGYVRQLDRNEAARLSTLLQATIKPAPSRSG